MFTERSLAPPVQRLHSELTPDVCVLDVEQDFETLPPAVAEELGLLVDSLDPASYLSTWLPENAPQPLQRYASSQFTIGLPGDGTVVWTRQTDPPTALVKARAAGTPQAFRSFLIAEALVEIDAGVPESFLPFFGDQYPDLDDALTLDGSLGHDGALDHDDALDHDGALGLDGASTYQVAAALFDAWVGLHTRDRFRAWEGTHDALHEAWVDAGERLVGRIEDLPGEVARGETGFPAATELACSAVKHDLDLPAPFAALDTLAYRDHGAAYAVRWAEKTIAALAE